MTSARSAPDTGITLSVRASGRGRCDVSSVKAGFLPGRGGAPPSACWLDGAVDPWVSREPQSRTDNRFRPMAERRSGLRAAPLFSGDGPRASYGQLELPREARSNHARAVAGE